MTNEVKALLKKAGEEINRDFANALDLKGTLYYLKVFQEIIAEFGSNEKHLATIVALKRRARRLMRYQQSYPIYVKVDSDGYVYKQWLEAKTLEEAKEEFAAYHYLPYFDRGYDCTGQLFTQTYRIFNVNGKYLLYHWVAEDC